MSKELKIGDVKPRPYEESIVWQTFEVLPVKHNVCPFGDHTDMYLTQTLFAYDMKAWPGVPALLVRMDLSDCNDLELECNMDWVQSKIWNVVQSS